MDFFKSELSEDNEIRIIHCKNCDCEDKERAHNKEQNAKVTGGQTKQNEVKLKKTNHIYIE